MEKEAPSSVDARTVQTVHAALRQIPAPFSQVLRCVYGLDEASASESAVDPSLLEQALRALYLPATPAS